MPDDGKWEGVGAGEGKDSRLARKDKLGDNGPRCRGRHRRDHVRLAGLGRDDICASVGLIRERKR